MIGGYQMSYDLEVCVLGQSNIKIKPQRFGDIYLNVDPELRKAYADTFAYMAEQDGVWCSITEKVRLFSAMNICDIMCVKNKGQAGFPFWVDEDADMYVMQIVPEHRAAVLSVLEYLIEFSPKKQIMLLPRLQGYEADNVCGVLGFDDFKRLLDDGKILFNICYIIGK